MQTNLLIIGNKTYSSWSFRAWLMLRAAGEPFEELRLPLNTAEFDRCIGDYSPARRVPVLLRDGFAIWDTLAIGETLAERHPSLWPADDQARARARSVSAEMHAGYEALRAELPFNCRAKGRDVVVSAAANADIERIGQIWDECLDEFGGPCLFGEFGIADAMFAPVALRFHTYAIPLSESSRRYVDTLRHSPDVHEWVGAAKREVEVIEAEEVGD